MDIKILTTQNCVINVLKAWPYMQLIFIQNKEFDKRRFIILALNNYSTCKSIFKHFKQTASYFRNQFYCLILKLKWKYTKNKPNI